MVICDAENDLGSEGFLGGTDYSVPLFCFLEVSTMYNRVINFAAGPSTLPLEVLEEISEDLMNYKGTHF